MQCRPARGEGKRYLDCAQYEDCLDIAGLQNWKSWNCESCDIYRVFFEGAKMEEKQENKRICKECHKRPTISPNNPYCPVCLGVLGHKKQVEKELSTGETGKPQEGPAETLTIGISITIPKELVRLVFSSR